MKPRNLDVSLADTGDDWALDLDPEVLQEVCYKAEMEFARRKEKERSEMQERAAKQSRYNDQDVKTPAQTTTTAAATAGIASSSRTPAAAAHERRVVRVPAQLRSPYVDPQNADPFYCSKEVCDIYDAVCEHSTPRTRSKGNLTNNSHNELANCIASGKKMDSLVVEIAIISLRGPEIRPKKRIMPLRIVISFPTLEILDKENPKETGHYWVLVLNITDKRFEVLDSARTLKDKAFLATALKIIDGIKANWRRHYNSSSVQISDWGLQEIKSPRQDNGKAQ
ncbi:hypothetical protein D1007_02703 [Hordeum vulgare]|nr:hypothetical protein D1007_02703 [Hordeum vulgare]